MKKNILYFLMPLLLSMGAAAQAQEWCAEDTCCVDERNFYAKFLGGVNFLQDTTFQGNKSTYETGYIVAGSLGYISCYGINLEFEYAFRRNEIRKIHFFKEGSSKHGHLQTSSYMANLLWNVPLSLWGCRFWNIEPFIGAGVGHDFQHMYSSNSRINFHQKWNRFSWQVMAGLTYPFFCNTELTLEYKFHQGGHHFYNHSIGVGLVYKFDFFKPNLRL